MSRGDALIVCVAIRDAKPEQYERAALRWIARYCVERPAVTLAEVRAATEAFERMAQRPVELEHSPKGAESEGPSADPLALDPLSPLPSAPDHRRFRPAHPPR